MRKLILAVAAATLFTSACNAPQVEDDDDDRQEQREDGEDDD